MAETITGRMTDPTTIKLDYPLSADETEIIIRLIPRKRRTKINVPEKFVLNIAEIDIEEFY